MTAYILNLLDLAVTLHVVANGGAELNPAVRWMLDVHPLCYPFAKIVVAGVLLLWLERKARQYKSAHYGLIAITALYGLLAIWHIVNFAALWAA